MEMTWERKVQAIADVVTEELDNLVTSASKLLDAWQMFSNETGQYEIGFAKYPFGASFDEILFEMTEWRQEFSKELRETE